MPDDESTNPTASGPGAGGDGTTPADDPGRPTILSRKELRDQRGGGSRTKWYVLGGVAVVLVGAVLGRPAHPGLGGQEGGRDHDDHPSGRPAWPPAR